MTASPCLPALAGSFKALLGRVFTPPSIAQASCGAPLLGPHGDSVLLDHGGPCPEHREQVLCQPWSWRVLPHVGGHQVERAQSLHKLALGLGAWPEGARAPHRSAKPGGLQRCSAWAARGWARSKGRFCRRGPVDTEGLCTVWLPERAQLGCGFSISSLRRCGLKAAARRSQKEQTVQPPALPASAFEVI